MAKNPANIKIGSAWVSWGGTDLGYTKGNVKLKLKQETHDVTVDQLGKLPIKSFLLNEEASVVVPLVERDVATNLLNGFGENIGKDIADNAQQLEITPQATGDSLSITFYKAYPVIDTEIEFSPDSERVVEIEFRIFPQIDTTTGQAQLGTITL